MTAASEDECEEDESEEDHVKLVEEDSAESVAGQVRKRGSFGEFHPRMVTEPCPSVLRLPHAAPGGLVCVASGHVCGLVEGPCQAERFLSRRGPRRYPHAPAQVRKDLRATRPVGRYSLTACRRGPVYRDLGRGCRGNPV